MKARADFFESFKTAMLTSKRVKNRLKRYWGTTTIDGVEVFNKKFVVYPGQYTERVTRITNMLGMTSQIQNNKYSGIDEYYLWLNPDKITDSEKYAVEIIANKLNKYMDDGTSSTITLNIADPSNPNKFRGYTDQQILAYVDTNYSDKLAYDYIEVNGANVLEGALGHYVLLDDNEHLTVEVLNASLTAVSNHITNNTGRSLITYTTGISLELKYTKNSDFTDTSKVVVEMYSDKNQYRISALQTLMDSPSNISSSVLPDKGEITNSLWYKGHLRVSLTDSHVFSRDKFMDVFVSTVDSGYKKKKVKWYKKLLSVVVFLVAVYLSAITAGQSLHLFALYMGISAVVITGMQLALASSGEEGAAAYMGKFAQIAGTISTIAGVASLVNNIGREAIKQGILASAREAAINAITTTTTTVTAAVQTVGTQALQTTTTEVVRELSFSKLSTVALKVITKLANFRNEMKAKDLESQIRDTSDEVTALRRELEDVSDKSLHLGIEDIKWYTSPLRTDTAEFQVDYLYEGTKYNILRPSFYTATALNIRT